MTSADAQNLERALPSRTSILVAAARAFGSREPDECVRNPDSMADLLIGPSELELIMEHPISTALGQDYTEASQNPVIVMFTGLMLWRTRFIDEALERAVKNGATQVVILGAGFDSRAYRFRELLRQCRVIEVDTASTQEYKRRRVREAFGEAPANVMYCTIDFAKDSLIDSLRQVGFVEGERTFYIWEGVCMYLPEDAVRKTLQTVASHSASGSSLVLDYANHLGIEYGRLNPNGPGGIPASWREPWIFGVPDADGRDFFRELGFDPGVPLSAISPEMVKRYGTRQDGTSYAAHVLEGLQREAQARAQVQPSDLFEVQKAIAAAGGAYWFAELAVLDRSVKG